MFDKRLFVVVGVLLLTSCSQQPEVTESEETVVQATPTVATSPLMTNTTITVPETDFVVGISSETGATVEYGDRENAPEEGYGTVTLLDEYTQPMADGGYVSVIAVNSGGSGTFQYLASFEPGEASWQMTSAVPLGDRIQVEGIEVVSDGAISVNYLEHGPDQAMAEEPNSPVSEDYVYSNGELIVKE